MTQFTVQMIALGVLIAVAAWVSVLVFPSAEDTPAEDESPSDDPTSDDGIGNCALCGCRDYLDRKRTCYACEKDLHGD